MPHKPFHRHTHHRPLYWYVFEVYNKNHDLMFETKIRKESIEEALPELNKECLEKTGQELCFYKVWDESRENILEEKKEPDPLKEFTFIVYPPDGLIRPLGTLKIEARTVEGATYKFMEKTGQLGANYQVHDERGNVCGGDFSFREEHELNGITYAPSFYQELAEAKISQMLGESKKVEQTQEIDEEESLE